MLGHNKINSQIFFFQNGVGVGGEGGGGMLGHNKINSQILIYFFSKMAGWGVSGEIFFIFPGLH